MAILARLALFLYGLGVIGGGFMGYHEAGSKASLIAGSISGAVAILALFLSFKRRFLGFSLGIITAGAVGFMMSKRWLDKVDRGFADMPFLVTAASAVVLVLLVLGLFSGGKKQSPPTPK